ncbi:MAG: hypothetical protein ACOH10_10715 [Rhodoglobus sp.]
MNPRSGRAALLAAAIAATVVLPASVAHAADIPLTGENLPGRAAFVFDYDDYPTDGSNPAGCDPDGQSVIEITQSGTATGPYSGPYTEHAVIIIGPQSPVDPTLYPDTPGALEGSVISFRAEFTINSPAGLVTGTKRLDPTSTHLSNTGSCFGELSAVGDDFGYPFLSDFSYAMRSFDANLTYSATVTPPIGGAFTDAGSASAQFGEGRTKGTCTGGTDPITISMCQSLEDNYGDRTIDNGFHGLGFREYFYASTGTHPVLPPPPAMPTNADQCKKDGYKSFGVFRNQGDCVSFVKTGGTNPPARTG